MHILVLQTVFVGRGPIDRKGQGLRIDRDAVVAGLAAEWADRDQCGYENLGPKIAARILLLEDVIAVGDVSLWVAA